MIVFLIIGSLKSFLVWSHILKMQSRKLLYSFSCPKHREKISLPEGRKQNLPDTAEYDNSIWP